MRRALTSLAIAGSAMLLPAIAHAQLKPERVTGSIMPVKPQPVDAERSAEIRKGFASCVYRNSKAKVMALLDNSDPQTVDLAASKIHNIVDDLRMERCLGDEAGVNQLALGMRITPEVVRDLMAEEAYLAVNRTPPQVPAASELAVPARYVSTGEALSKAEAMVAFTDCAVLKDVTHADALLRTKPASKDERLAAHALAPALGACLAQGQQVVLTPESIRAFMAYAMWNRFGRRAAQ